MRKSTKRNDFWSLGSAQALPDFPTCNDNMDNDNMDNDDMDNDNMHNDKKLERGEKSKWRINGIT